MAKKEKSSFQLKKGAAHNFDISKGGKRKFDLTKDEDEPVIAPAKLEQAKPQKPVIPSPSPVKPAKPVSVNDSNASSQPSNEAEPKVKKNINAWIWISLIIIIALLAWWIWPSSESSKKVEDNPIEEVSEPATETEETTVDTTVPAEDENVVNQNEEGQGEAGNVPTEPAKTSTAPSTEANSKSTSVNQPAGTPTVSGDIETEAYKVIRGEYGSGETRKTNLGDKYHSIQNRVNELKRKGVF